MRREVRQHPVGQRPRVPSLRAADADAKPQKLLRLQMLRDRAQAVVAGETAAEPQLEPAELEIALVVHDEDGLGRHLEERRGHADRAARLVHVRLGLEEGELVPLEPDLGDPPGELRPPGAAVPACELVRHHRADVVPVARVLATGIAQPDDEQVERGPVPARP